MKLRYTLRAAQELEHVLSYIDERARQVKARIQATIELIALHPKAGQLTSKRRLRRVVAHPYPYLIFYSVGR